MPQPDRFPAIETLEVSGPADAHQGFDALQSSTKSEAPGGKAEIDVGMIQDHSRKFGAQVWKVEDTAEKGQHEVILG